MIDEKFFAMIKRASFDWNRPVQIEEEHGKELFRLAKLGLWAEKYGVPIIERAVEVIEGPAKGFYEARGATATTLHLREALAALPKDTTQ